MLTITVDTDRLQYDIHSLVKAFYPGEEVKVDFVPGGDGKKESAPLVPDGDEEKKKEPFMKIVLTGQHKGIFFAPGKEEKEVFYPFAAKGGAEGNVSAFLDDADFTGKDKNALKRFLYETLRDYAKSELPWGNLTGIRPTKIVMGMLAEGKSDEQIRGFMMQNHYVSEKKAELALTIARLERELLSRLDAKDGYSLYIGIPFCPTTCLYCSFTSYPIAAYQKCVDRYLDCLCRELDYVAAVYGDKKLQSVYVGGGTPTTLSPVQLARLLSHVRERFDLSRLLEFTVEAGRADSITKEKLAVLRECGVTRISVNPQTMKDETLRLIGRRHTTEQVKEAFAMAREAGFDNINMDIILGLPGEGKEDVRCTVKEIEALSPDALTVHSLAVKRASGLLRFVQENGIDCLNNTEETMETAALFAARMQMKPYYLYRQKNMSGNLENVGYAREGKYGIYNILIMEEVQTIVACGAGSITKRVYPDGRIERCENVKDVKLYMEKIDEMIERKRKLLASGPC